MTQEEIKEEINFKLSCIELVKFQIDLNGLFFSYRSQAEKDEKLKKKLNYENEIKKFLNEIEDLKELDIYLDFIKNDTNFDNV